jgi:pSer/pThr/pTyr-binding forkhead associated (FHA) protein
MTDTVLDLLKLALLGLLYLFFGRVLWAVWSEVRAPRSVRAGVAPGQAAAAPAPAAKPAPASGPAPTRGTSRGGRGKAATTLVVLEPKANRGATFAIAGEVTIGRDTGCTITIADDTFVSGVHARVVTIDGQPMVEDLGSTNGSFHNGNKLSGMSLLHIGDRIQFGYTVLEAR